MGYWLDKTTSDANQCVPCSGNCKSCDDAFTCNECETRGDMHYPKDPNEDVCTCNKDIGWEQVPDKLFACTCTKGFINE